MIYRDGLIGATSQTTPINSLELQMIFVVVVGDRRHPVASGGRRAGVQDRGRDRPGRRHVHHQGSPPDEQAAGGANCGDQCWLCFPLVLFFFWVFDSHA